MSLPAKTTLAADQGASEVYLLSRNKDLADVLGLIASYYTMARDTYRARSFANASANISSHPFAILSGAQARRELPSIGDRIAADIDEFITSQEQTVTGTVKRLQELEARFKDRKATIDFFRSIYGIGPVTAVKFYNQGFRTLEDVWLNANLNDAQKIGIMWRDHIALRIPRGEMDLINQKIGSILDPYKIEWTIAGSYRRGEPSSGDIDVLVESRPDLNMEGLIHILKPILPATLAKGPTKFMGIVRIDEQHNGHRIDIRLVDSYSFAAALMYFTGSQRFNILMRKRAIELGMILNEYGIFYSDNNRPLIIQSEEDIFAALRVKYMAPVDRTKTIAALVYI